MRMATSNVLEMVGIDMFEGSFSIGRGPCRLPALPIFNLVASSRYGIPPQLRWRNTTLGSN